MVKTNNKDPVHEINDELESPSLEALEDTDNEDYENEYQPLPVEDYEVYEEQNNDENYQILNHPVQPLDITENISNEPLNNPLPDIIPMENDLLKDVWSKESSFKDIEMDSEKVNEVKQVMVNITLPEGSIPEWAENVPENQWKEYLMDRLQSLKNN